MSNPIESLRAIVAEYDDLHKLHGAALHNLKRANAAWLISDVAERSNMTFEKCHLQLSNLDLMPTLFRLCSFENNGKILVVDPFNECMVRDGFSITPIRDFEHLVELLTHYTNEQSTTESNSN